MDMKQLWQHVKDTVLKDGEHIPMIYAETKERIDFIAVVSDAETTMEKHRFLFSAGRRMAEEHKGEDLIFLCFVTEAWVSTLKPGEQRKYAPSQDPKRREAIIAQVMNLTEKPAKQLIYMAEMIRDDSGKLIDLLPNDEATEAEYTLLPPFLAGWLSAPYSNKDLVDMAVKAVNDQGGSVSANATGEALTMLQHDQRKLNALRWQVSGFNRKQRRQR